MSGAVAAHAAYNGSGTQGLAVTNKIHEDDGDVMSVFWNKNDTTRQLLYGSSIIEIPPSGSGGALGAGGNQIFTVNNDIDAVGDLYLQIESTDASGTVLAFDLLSCIKRIEFMVGTQVWQTLEGADITALNMTEMSEDAFESFFLAMTGGFTKQGVRNKIATSAQRIENPITSDIAGVIRIPALSRSVGPKFAKFTDISENAYLLAGAPHQSVKIRVYTANSLPLDITNLTLKLFGQCIVMCNEEREQIKAMPAGLPKRLKMTQNVNKSQEAGFEQNYTLDLDHFSLYSSHLIITVTGEAGLDSAELKLNSSSFSGTIDAQLLDGTTAASLGLISNSLDNIMGNNMRDADQSRKSIYVFPLASRAYGGSSVPLNRFDNIRLVLSFSKDAKATTVNVTCVGETTSQYKGGASSLAMY